MQTKQPITQQLINRNTSYTVKDFTYIYIYIYIITVLVVTKSLCGFVSNQVQYNVESAQYLG